VEWHLDASDPGRMRDLRHEFVDYLAARAAADSDLDAAKIVLAELLANVHRHAPGPATVSLDWEDQAAVLTVADLGSVFTPEIALPDPQQEDGRGLYVVQQIVGEISVSGSPDGTAVSVRLPVRRRADAV
jgi:anti-sigma regulatory factor (Ser/Thr protein kinase)